MISGARILLHTLEKLSVKHLFAYPGGAVIPIFNELYDFENINVHFCRHEQGAGHNAEGYGAVLDLPGVCLVTSGPGVTNTVTAIMDAQMDSRPLMVISGQVPSSMIGKMAFQECNIEAITKPITKRSIQVHSIKALIEETINCYFLANHGRKGPTLIDIPKDLQLQTFEFTILDTIDEAIEKYRLKYETKVAKNTDITAAINLIKQANQPIVLAGAGIKHAKSQKELYDFIVKQNLPIVTTLHGIDVFDNFDPHFLGMVGMHGLAYANYALDHADVVIALGVRFDDRITSNPQTFIPNAKIIHVEIDPTEINKMKPATIALNSDLKTILNQFNNLEKVTKDLNSWFDHLIKLKKTFPLKLNSSKTLQMRDVIIKANLNNENSLVVSDVGQHQMFVAQYFKFKTGKLINSGGSGTMGFAIPAAIGMKIAAPLKRVLCFVGDGGFQMTNQELITLSTIPQGIKFILLNNSYLGMVRQWQELFHSKRYSFVDLENSPNFTDLAKAYNLEAVVINNLDDLEKAAEKFTNNQNYLFICNVEKEENVFPMIPSGKSIKEMEI